MRSRLVSETRSPPISRTRSPFGFFRARNSSAEIAGPSLCGVCLTLPNAGLEIFLFLALCIIILFYHPISRPACPAHLGFAGKKTALQSDEHNQDHISKTFRLTLASITVLYSGPVAIMK